MGKVNKVKSKSKPVPGLTKDAVKGQRRLKSGRPGLASRYDGHALRSLRRLKGREYALGHGVLRRLG